MSYDVETDVALPPETGEQPTRYPPEYIHGYTAGYRRAPFMSPEECAKEKNKLRGHDWFSAGWRDYFREHH